MILHKKINNIIKNKKMIKFYHLFINKEKIKNINNSFNYSYNINL